MPTTHPFGPVPGSTIAKNKPSLGSLGFLGVE
jgi:hypothetical protein